jgi:hypothetical protein
MSIRLKDSYANCESLIPNSKYKVLVVIVNTSYTCDRFEVKAVIKMI